MLRQRLSHATEKIARRLAPRLAQRLEQAEQERDRLNRLIDLVSRDDLMRWLYLNRFERMDPTVPDLFVPVRAEFHLARYRFASRLISGLKVADIACGTGYGSEFLKQTGGAKEVHGVDIDADAIRYAQGRHGGTGLVFHCADGTATGLKPGEFDAVISFETLEHIPHPDQLLREFCRLLSPTGRLIISVPNAWSLQDAPYHLHCLPTEEIEALLKSFFGSTEFWAQNSGSTFKYNHGQPAGIVPLAAHNRATAECIVAVCGEPK
jgi:2-polyprenyl-3-methyl-5-hydroxy-6-metoxy-1,4-benzoquinol methylase